MHGATNMIYGEDAWERANQRANTIQYTAGTAETVPLMFDAAVKGHSKAIMYWLHLTVHRTNGLTVYPVTAITMQLKETSFFDVWTEQCLKKYIHMHHLFIIIIIIFNLVADKVYKSLQILLMIRSVLFFCER